MTLVMLEEQVKTLKGSVIMMKEDATHIITTNPLERHRNAKVVSFRWIEDSISVEMLLDTTGINNNLLAPKGDILKGCFLFSNHWDNFKDKRVVQESIESQGGQIVYDFDSSTHVLCDSRLDTNYERALQSGKTVVSTFWIFDVLRDGVKHDPKMHIHMYPKRGEIIPNADKLIISISNYTGMARERIKFMINEMGATYTGTFSPENTHLVCNDSTTVKFQKAKEFSHVKIVNHLWIEDTFNAWKIQKWDQTKYQTIVPALGLIVGKTKPIFELEEALPSSCHVVQETDNEHDDDIALTFGNEKSSLSETLETPLKRKSGAVKPLPIADNIAKEDDEPLPEIFKKSKIETDSMPASKVDKKQHPMHKEKITSNDKEKEEEKVDSEILKPLEENLPLKKRSKQRKEKLVLKIESKEIGEIKENSEIDSSNSIKPTRRRNESEKEKSTSLRYNLINMATPSKTKGKATIFHDSNKNTANEKVLNKEDPIQIQVQPLDLPSPSPDPKDELMSRKTPIKRKKKAEIPSSSKKFMTRPMILFT
ncbi:hypothetical protein O9G_005806, partial [Rozella allomycis CSF55]